MKVYLFKSNRQLTKEKFILLIVKTLNLVEAIISLKDLSTSKFSYKEVSCTSDNKRKPYYEKIKEEY